MRGQFTFAAKSLVAQVGVASFASRANFAADLVKRDVTRHVKEERKEILKEFYIYLFFFK